MKKYLEWSVENNSYSRFATVQVNGLQERSSRELIKFENNFGLISTILSRSFKEYKNELHTIQRRTKRIGRLNPTYVANELVRAYSGQELTQKIYDKRNSRLSLEKHKNIAIGLLLDMSGSTRFDVCDDFRRIDLIKYSTIALGRILSTLDESLFAYGFHSHETSNPTIMEKLKSADQVWDNSIEEKIAAIEHTAHTDAYNNKDGAAIRFANEELLKLSQVKKYLVLLTDGVPNCDDTYYRGRTAFEDTAKAMSEGFRAGISYVYLTINPDDVSSFSKTIIPYTFLFKQFRKMQDVVEGLPLSYEKIKKHHV